MQSFEWNTKKNKNPRSSRIQISVELYPPTYISVIPHSGNMDKYVPSIIPQLH